MKSFKLYFKPIHSHEVELYIHKHGIDINSIKSTKLNEKQYHSNELEHLDGELHKTLSEFKPSSLDHETIANEFHRHLHEHGYYAHTPNHPLVMSPEEQQFKSDFKTKTKKRVLHIMPHRDGGSGSATQTMGRFTALWSNKSPTIIYNNQNKPIPGTSIDGHPTIIDDSKVKHGASANNNRWFLRQGEIRKIPDTGLQVPTKTGTKSFENDIDGYIGAKKPYTANTLARDVSNFFEKSKVPGSHESNIEPHVKDWITRNHPQYLPKS